MSTDKCRARLTPWCHRAELENFPEGEVGEMVQLYVRKGLKEEKAKSAVEAMITEHEFFVDVMMLVCAPSSSYSLFVLVCLLLLDRFGVGGTTDGAPD